MNIFKKIHAFMFSKEIFLTHTYGDWCRPGKHVESRDKVYVVHYAFPVSRTALHNGGSAPCWSIRGVET